MIGTTLSHYRITAKLGEGGMGEVYRAEDTTLKREVALKVLPPDLATSTERLERFQREAETLAALDHQNIVSIYSVEQTEDVHFLTMQLVEGKRLSEVIPRGGLELETLFSIAIPLADALAAAHDKGVIHRDLKPTNVMVSTEGRVKVLDFGLAKLRPEAEAPVSTELPTEPLTDEGRIVGTVPYMSPEQLEGGAIDGRADVFSLGVILYEIATGERPFVGDSSVALISSIMKDSPREVNTLRGELPHQLGRIIEHCLEKDRLRRFQTARDVANELATLRQELEAEEPAPGGGRRRFRHRPGLIVGLTATLLVVAAAALYLSLGRLVPTAGERQFASLAVLPLDNLMEDPDQEYFVDGMTEALITDLAKIGALKVISRTSVMRYKRTDESIPEIAAALGVDAVVEGSVLRVGDEVRITAQLIDGRTDEHLWAESYTREMENVLALHGEVARAIAAEIEVAVTTEESDRLIRGRRVDPKALQAYLKGQYSLSRRTAEGLHNARGSFRQAIDIEPLYALAHSGLAQTYTLLATYELSEPKSTYGEAKAAALRALELDDSLAEPLTSLGWIRLAHEWDWSGAERDFQRAIELNPSYATAHQWYAELLSILGRHQEAMVEIRRAQELDPLSLITNAVAGWVLLYARQYDQAIEELHQVLGMDPSFPNTHAYLGRAYRAKGMKEAAVAEHEKACAVLGGEAIWINDLAISYAALGRRNEALEILEQLKLRTTVPEYGVAKIRLALGDTEGALAWLEKGFEARAEGMLYLKVEPQFDPLRNDPRFQNLLLRMNFPE